VLEKGITDMASWITSGTYLLSETV